MRLFHHANLTLYFFAITLCSSSAFAAEPCKELERNYSAPMEVECARANFDKSDQLLNNTYKEVIVHLKDEGRDLKPLILAERAWVAERDARCNERAKELDLIDQSGVGAILNCKTEWTFSRIALLKDYLH